MNPEAFAIAAIAASYLIGAIPFGLFFGFWAGIDVRSHGSGNIGFTNVLRVCGAKWGVPVLILDIAKGWLPAFAIQGPWAGEHLPESWRMWVCVAVGLASIIGHTFPIYLRFKGGKGVATSAGALLAIAPFATGIAILSFAIMLAATRYVSASSTFAAVAILLAHHLKLMLAGIPALEGAMLPPTILLWLTSVLIIVKHRSNYVRLWNGTENKLFAKKP